jgi:hypothetical protein
MSLETGKNIAKRKSIAIFALWGAVGFGVGGIIGASLWLSFIMAGTSFPNT